MAGHLTLTHLYVVAFVVGTLDIVFFVAYQALLVAVVKPGEYIAASSLLNGSRALTQVGGLLYTVTFTCPAASFKALRGRAQASLLSLHLD